MQAYLIFVSVGNNNKEGDAETPELILQNKSCISMKSVSEWDISAPLKTCIVEGSSENKHFIVRPEQGDVPEHWKMSIIQQQKAKLKTGGAALISLTTKAEK